MKFSTHLSQRKLIFHGKQTPEERIVVGYASIIDKLAFQISVIK
ncbi:MAG: hypothetical protein U9N85_09485 [Bacteroidota bacterium]|nr:hypothetical protein [Bacteroidota bacterium]